MVAVAAAVVVVVKFCCISLISFHRIRMKFGGKVHHDMKPRKKRGTTSCDVMTSFYDVIPTYILIVFDCDSYTSRRS